MHPVAAQALADARFAALAALVRREFPDAPGLLLRGEALIASLEAAAPLDLSPAARDAGAAVALLPQLLAPEVWSATWFFLLGEFSADDEAPRAAKENREALMGARETLRQLAHPDSPEPASAEFRARLGDAMARVSADFGEPDSHRVGGVAIGNARAREWAPLLHRFRDRLETSRAFAAEIVWFDAEGSNIRRVEGTTGDVSDAYGV